MQKMLGELPVVPVCQQLRLLPLKHLRLPLSQKLNGRFLRKILYQEPLHNEGVLIFKA
jgi:hypothetical protein